MKHKKWRFLKYKKVKKTLKVSRIIHIFISSALFSLMLFFSATGLTLNHTDWFSKDKSEYLTTIDLPNNLENKSIDDLEEFKTFLSTEFSLPKARSIDLDYEENTMSFDYSLPNGYVFVSIYLDEHSLEIEHSRGNTIGLLNDLHKGRHTGLSWSYLIDACAILFCLFSITGFLLLLQNKKYRIQGLYSAVFGFFGPIIFYYMLVPNISLSL